MNKKKITLSSFSYHMSKKCAKEYFKSIAFLFRFCSQSFDLVPMPKLSLLRPLLRLL